MPKFGKDPINRTEKPDMIHMKPEKSSDVIKKMYEDFVKGIGELQKRIDKGESEESLEKTRKRLGSDAWSLRRYGYDIEQYDLKSLGIVPSMGKVIPRGSR